MLKKAGILIQTLYHIHKYKQEEKEFILKHEEDPLKYESELSDRTGKRAIKIKGLMGKLGFSEEDTEDILDDVTEKIMDKYMKDPYNWIVIHPDLDEED
jgi:hypothetical protein